MGKGVSLKTFVVSVQPPFRRRRGELAPGAATRYNRGMIETMLPQAPDLWATVPAPDLAALLEQVAPLRRENAALRAENAALRAENVVLHERVRELDVSLG